MNIIKTPLNYTGNKSRLIDQIYALFPAKVNRFVDLCCGGATVGLNAIGFSKEVVCLDINRELISLLQTLQLFSESNIIFKMEEIIKKFALSDTYNMGYDYYRTEFQGNNGLKSYNKDGYYKMRDFFNTAHLEQHERSIYLFVLISYCFNNDMRFNSSGKFNMPVGKTDFNISIRDKLHSFKQGTKNKNIKFYCSDFSIVKEFELSRQDFVYCDPPYLITNAVYNDTNIWNVEAEYALLKTLDYLNKHHVKFALSNVLEKEGAKNDVLLKWIAEHSFKVVDIDYHYRSASYNKKNRAAHEREVVILNYDI